MKIEQLEEHQSSIGKNRASLISLLVYVIPMCLLAIPFIRYIAWLVPIMFLLSESNSLFVRYNAVQSTLLIGLLNIIYLFMILIKELAYFRFGYFLMSFEGGVFLLQAIFFIFFISYIIINIYCAIKSTQNKKVYVPLLGTLSQKLVYVRKAEQ